jgi:hypothetical protein
MTYPGAASPGDDQSCYNDGTNIEPALATKQNEYQTIMKVILPPYTPCRCVSGTSTNNAWDAHRQFIQKCINEAKYGINK